MSYYFTKKFESVSFDQVVENTTEALKMEGFGVLTNIDMRTTLKNKLDVDIPRYVILGACNPGFAYKAVQAEDNIGLLLPCNVIVYEKDNAVVVSIINPVVAMESVKNESLEPIATEVLEKLKRVISTI
ncbi:MAG: hypothetical protein CL840_00315 [Crocinitomicaceae bacterium]|nr:hypothetical protein [Crocinitomicaceae bacterium]|tara:strand:+ start:5405 stop:5791 length:387 start_codon:yes stop_codon:yes gene_type:complete